MLTGYTSNLPVDTLLSSGVMYKGGTVIGVTDGAPDFDPGDELGDIMFDQKPSRLKGTIRRVGFTPVIKGTLKEFGPSASGGQIATLETGSTEAIVGGVTTETPAAAGALIAAGSYLVDVRWLFERGSGGYAAIYFPFAHVRKWTKKGVDKKEAQIAFEIVAVGDPVNDMGTAPYAIEIRAALPGSPVTIVSDSFNRADNAASMGTADTGQVWTPLLGTWGISANQAYFAAGTLDDHNATVVESTKADCTAQVTMATVGPDNRIVFRATDVNNNWLVTGGGAGWRLFKWVANTLTQVGSTAGSAPVNGDVVKAILSGSSIQIYVNGALLISATDSFNSTATKHGIGENSSTPHFDDFLVTVP